MRTEKIIKVRNIQCHCYDGTQCETAIYAKSDKRKGYRWYVGYGADYMPASKSDRDNMSDYTYQISELAETIETGKYAGMTVIMYRNNN